jgi:serralysin
MTVTATDADLPPQAIAFSIVGGADQNRFSITSGGTLSFVAPPDFEAPADANADNIYVVTVQASDGHGGTASQTISVTVTGANDDPVFTSANMAFVPENTSAVMIVTATDPDRLPQTGPITTDAGIPTPGMPGFTTYTVTATVDWPIVAFDFAGNGSNAPATGHGFFGAMNQVNPFGLPTIFNDNNSVFTVVGSDVARDSQFKVTSSTVTVPAGLAEEGPNILQAVWAWSTPQANSISFAQLVIPDASGTVQYRGTITVRRDGANVDLPVTSGVLGRQPITFSIVGGPDQSRFTITPSGALSFISAPNFETPSDANGDNVYTVTVRATDSHGGTATQTINVNVTPVNEHTPLITSPDAVSVPENTTTVMTVSATDADLPPQALTFSIAGGADQSKFSITSGGVLSFISPPDFEAPTDANGDNVYVVIVLASDGSFANLQAILVTVTNIGEPFAGDYNNNGTVDAADYVLWRNTVGQTGAGLAADGNGNGTVDAADYNIWRANFGRTLGAAASASHTLPSTIAAPIENEKVPEPLSAADVSTVQGTVLPVEALMQSPPRRSSDHRPAPRINLSDNRFHDDALIAWLSAQTLKIQRGPLVPSVNDRWDERQSEQDSGEVIAAMDDAFATLEPAFGF